jgi:hypothetical protein
MPEFVLDVQELADDLADMEEAEGGEDAANYNDPEYYRGF